MAKKYLIMGKQAQTIELSTKLGINYIPCCSIVLMCYNGPVQGTVSMCFAHCYRVVPLGRLGGLRRPVIRADRRDALITLRRYGFIFNDLKDYIMNIHQRLAELTKFVRETKGSGDALRFYVKHIQPIKQYFGGDESVKNLTIPDVSCSLASQKAIEYAKFIHGKEYNDPVFAPDIEQTIRDFKKGFITAMQIANDS